MQQVLWQYYPHVAEHQIARAFVESLVKRQKRPKTVDAYARNVEDLMQAFSNFEILSFISSATLLLVTVHLGIP